MRETQPPRLRRDLEFTHRHLGEAVEVIVCDPLTGSYFRAGEMEAALFALLDGETPLDEITARLTQTYPDLCAEDVPAFVSHLGRLGFLEGSKAAQISVPLYRRLLYAQVRLANPDWLFARLVTSVAWLYRPAGLMAAGALCLAAGVVAVENRDDLRRGMAAAFTPGYWLWLWCGVILLGTIHEFGHGLTCKHFGGRSTGIGLLFLYGMPCFYCDVSGAWMLPRKSQRLWVGAAGLYYQFIAGALALMIWRVAEPGSFPSTIALVMAASCGILSLFNLNPLLKLDGYYLLSDALEISNLRQRAFAELGRWLDRFWFGRGRGEQEITLAGDDEGEARVRRICLVYAALASLFLVWLLPALLRSLGRFFIGRLGGTGALLLALLIGLQFGTPIAQAVLTLGRRLALWKEISMLGRRRLLMTGGVPVVLAPVIALLPWKANLTVPCKVEAAARAAVRARTDGVLAELTAREGSPIRRGQVIGHLATFEREQRRAEREAQRQTFRMEIAALQDRLPIVAAEAEKVTAQAETTAQEARTHFAEEQEILASRVVEAQGRVETAHAELQASRARLAEARAAVEAQSRIAVRLRGDADRALRGDDPPVVAAAREFWHQRVVERDEASREYERLRLLAADGAVAVQQLDTARTHSEAAGRAAEQKLHELAETTKHLREAADDAEAELVRRRAAQQAARAAEAAARATEASAREALRQVEACSGPAHLETARLRSAGGRAALTAARTADRELLARRAEIRAKRQHEAQLATQIAVLTDQIRRSALIATCDGVVTTPRVEERIGAHFDQGATVLQVEDPRRLCIRTFVNEKEVGAVHVGQPVALRLAAFPQRVYSGQVEEMAPRAVRGGTAAFPTNIVEVRLQVENPTGELRPGMSGWAKIECGRCSLGAILFRRVTRSLNTEVWSWF